MKLQVEKGILWARTLLVSSSVCKSLFIVICPDSIASLIGQQSLIELDKALAKEFPGPEPMQCLVVGGACLILQEVTNRATEDIDVIIFNLMGSEESTLIFKTPLALKIRRIIKRIGKQYGLKGEH